MREDRAWTPARTEEVRDLFAELLAEPDGSARREEVRTQLIEAHLGLVHHLARRFTPTLSLDDAVQVGSIGLIKAVDGFDPALGHEFASYAVPKVVGEIRRHMRDVAFLVRAPRRAQELQGAVTQARETLSHELGRSPTLSEIAERTGVDAHVVVEVLESFRSRDVQSLQPSDEDSEGGGPHHAAFSVDERGYEATEIRMDLAQAMTSLDEQEALVVRLRFLEGQSQSQIAAQVGVSQMQVSRILRRSVDRMRRRLSD